MTADLTTPTLEPKQKRLKGSLAGSLVKSLVIFTFIPLALMAGAAYFRAQTLLREQAVRQTENQLVSQLDVINKEIQGKEGKLGHLLTSSDFNILIELALHANPQSSEFRKIRASVLGEFESENREENVPAFDHFFIMDTDGSIKVATNEEWQGITLKDTSFIDQTSTEHPSMALYGLAPIYNNQFVLVTALEYKTARGSSLGILVGITEADSLNELIHPLQAYYPLANTYFILPAGQFISSNSETGELSSVSSLSSSQESLIPRLTQMMESGDTKPTAMDTT